MEKIIVLTIVFVSIGLLARKVLRMFKGKDLCGGCPNRKRCSMDTNEPFCCSKEEEVH